MGKVIALLLAAISLAGCGTTLSGYLYRKAGDVPPRSQGEAESGYTYIPIDPFPVQTVSAPGCDGMASGLLLDSLPDNAVRMLVERFNESGSVSYGVSKTGAQGETYRVTVDYINADTINVPVWIGKIMKKKGSSETTWVDIFLPPGPEVEPGTETFIVTRDPDEGKKENLPQFNLPVYIGVGLRVSANVFVVGANANISGIGVIGAEAEAERLKGSLVVQTLGVNGKSVAAALPIQSELNRTTAQNAIVAVGSIKALLYADETIKSPRVVGIYLPFPGGKPLVNALISELSKARVKWERPCLTAPTAPARRS